MRGDRDEAGTAGSRERTRRRCRGAASSRSSDCSAVSVAIADGGGREPVDLVGEARRVLAGRERDDAQAVGMRVDDRQRAPADRAGRAEDGDALHQVCRYRTNSVIHRAGEQPAVDAIEDAAVPGNERRRILHAGAALEQRLEQIADDAQQDDDQPRHAPASPATTAGNT